MTSLIYRYILQSKPKSFKRKVFQKLRSTILKFLDDTVLINIGKSKIYVRFSHDFPIFYYHIPYFSRNITRLSSFLQKNVKQFAVVDIGANVGDTAVIILNEVETQILCIEGENTYFELLQKNSKSLNGIIPFCGFVGDPGEKEFNVVSEGGTARLESVNRSEGITGFHTLSHIISETSFPENPTLVKIDTDGFDVNIMRTELDFFKNTKPVLYFEYDPRMLKSITENYIGIFKELAHVGYKNGIIYKNTGEMMFSFTTDDEILLKDLSSYYLICKNEYADIVLFHEKQDVLFQKFLDEERRFTENEIAKDR